MELISKAGYKKLKEQYNQTKSKDIYDRINNCQIIEETKEYASFNGRVIAGSKVKVSFRGDESDYIILGDNESDTSNNVLSYKSPLAQILLGKHKNDMISFNARTLIVKEVDLL